MSQLSLPHGTNNYIVGKTEKNKQYKTGILRSIGKQPGEFVESVLKKKRKAAVARIRRKGRF